MKNKLKDLNDHLFAQMERLSNEDLSGDQLKAEIDRSKALTNVANSIISNGQLVLKAQIELGGARKGAAEDMLLGNGEDPGKPAK